MSIDLKTHRVKLLEAWRNVTEDKNATDWALFGYDGHTNTLKLVSSGDGGLLELAEDLNSNQIMYGFCRLTDPKTGLPKFVLINWQGEGAPMSRKGSCANHIRDVAALLHGHHLTVHARDEDEVDEANIVDKLARSGSSSYDFHQRAADDSPPSKPVGTNYRRVVPAAEIDLSARDKFWEKQEQEEKERRLEEQRRLAEEKVRLETERNRREMEEAKGREHAALERSRSINEARQAERKAERMLSGADKEALRWQASLEQDRVEEEERTHRADRLRAERKQEAQQLIGHRTGAARAVFERNTSAGQLRSPTSPVSTGGGVARRWPPAPAHSTEPKAQLNGSASDATISNGHQKPAAATPPAPVFTASQPSSSSSAVAASPSLPSNSLQPEPEEAPPVVPAHAPQQSEPPTAVLHTAQPVYKPAEPATVELFQPAVISPAPSQAAQQLAEAARHPAEPAHQPAGTATQQHELAAQPSEPSSVSPTASQMAYSKPAEPADVSHTPYQPEPVLANTPSSATHIPVHQPAAEPEPAAAEPQLAAAAGVHNMEPVFFDSDPEPAAAALSAPAAGGTSEVQITTVTGELASVTIATEHGLCAQALYDYQALDDTEITFDPGDIITNIDRIDEGWWQGISPTGQFGLFPANYVQLINA